MEAAAHATGPPLKTYAVKEVFATIQGEGFNAGRRAVFVRFAGCNMWNGLRTGRLQGKAPCSQWCDTDFVGGERLELTALLSRVLAAWGKQPRRFVVITGGEPGLQLDEPLIEALLGLGFDVAVESNGSIELPGGNYWRTISPKTPHLAQRWGDELKLIFPTLDPVQFEGLDFRHFYLQPLDSPIKGWRGHAKQATEFIMNRPRWRLSLQIHKELGIP